MAYITILFVIFAAIYNVNSSETNEPCPCNELDLKDDALLWTLMKKLSIDIPEEDRDVYTVLPGQLSPLIDCNCEEYNRKKRKTEPEEAPLSVEEEVKKETKTRRHVRLDVDCPLGLVRFGIRCVEEDYFDY